MPLGYSPQNMETITDPYGIIASNWTLWHWDTPCLGAIIATVLLVRTMEKIVLGFPLTIFVPHALEALQNCHHTQHFSFSLLNAPLIDLLQSKY